MAASGAGVLQLRSVEYARNHGVRIHCRQLFEDGPGTLVVSEEETMEQPLDHRRHPLDRRGARHADRRAATARRRRPHLRRARRGQRQRRHDHPERAGLRRRSGPTSRSPSPRDDLRDGARRRSSRLGDELGVEVRDRRADGQGLDRRRRHAQPPRRRREGLHGARRAGHQHRDDLHLADQDLLRDRRRPACPTPSARCTRPSSSARRRHDPAPSSRSASVA